MEKQIEYLTSREYNLLDLPHSIDLSHHLSDLAKARAVSPLKGLWKYYGRPGMLALAGGMLLISHSSTS